MKFLCPSALWSRCCGSLTTAGGLSGLQSKHVQKWKRHVECGIQHEIKKLNIKKKKHRDHFIFCQTVTGQLLLIHHLPSNSSLRFNGKAGYIPSMYLQLYNNPRAGLYNLRKHHNSTLNLATSREPEYSSMYRENSPHLGEASSIMPSRLHKAQSLDILSETWTPAHLNGDASDDIRERSISRASQSSSSSEFSSSSKEEHQNGSSSPDISLSHNKRSSMKSDSSGSLGSTDSEKSSGAPRVPPRPKTEEIMTRCSTMTRKAALATKTRLQFQQPESPHSR